MSGAVLVTATISATAAAAATSLGDFDNLQSDQLDLGAAILQHLLSCGQHLILDNDITSRDNKLHFITALLFFSPHRSAGMGAHSQTTHWLNAVIVYHHNKWQNMKKSPATVLGYMQTQLISLLDKNKCQRKDGISEKNMFTSAGNSMTLHFTNLRLMLLAE